MPVQVPSSHLRRPCHLPATVASEPGPPRLESKKSKKATDIFKAAFVMAQQIIVKVSKSTQEGKRWEVDVGDFDDVHGNEHSQLLKVFNTTPPPQPPQRTTPWNHPNHPHNTPLKRRLERRPWQKTRSTPWRWLGWLGRTSSASIWNGW